MQIGILKAIGVVVFLYLTWRNSKENYGDEKLISYSWLSLLVFLVGGRLTYGLLNFGAWNDSIANWFLVWQKPGMNYIGAYLFWVLASIIYAQKNEWRVWSFLEESIGNFGIFILFIMADEILRGGGESLGLQVLLLLVGTGILTVVLGKKYRSFVWYRSGKKGFLFFFSNMIFWFLMVIRAFIFKDGFQPWGLYLTLCLISVAGLFILGEVFGQLSLLFVGKRRKNEK